jgi:hypothetical protein
MRRALSYMLLASSVALYGVFNPLRVEHVAMLAIGIGLAGLSRTTRDLVVSFLPMLIFVWVYDLMRLFRERAWDAVVVEDVYRLEQTLFGWLTPRTGDLGPVDWFRDHHHVVLDCLGGLWYSAHMPAIVLFGAYLWWRTRRDETDGRARRRLDRFLWGFLAMSVVGLVVQAWCPVAPPWYVEQFGFAPPGEPIEGDPAALARVDALLGIDYFASIYGQSAYVFGALPSLHVATPVWLALHVRHRIGRPLAWGFAAAMAFFAVYLTHHYVVDVLAGVVLALVVYLPMAWTSAARWPVRLRRRLHVALFDRLPNGSGS